MYFLLKDLFAGFVSAQILLPIILAVEWDFDNPIFGMFVMFLTAAVFGWLMYSVFVYFGVSNGIVSGPGPRDLSMRAGLLVGLIFGCFFGNYLVKPLFYKIYFSIKKKN